MLRKYLPDLNPRAIVDFRSVLLCVARHLERVLAWHRAGFRLYWRSRSRGGQPKIAVEIRTLIQQMANDNSGRGAPRLHAELQKLGFVVPE